MNFFTLLDLAISCSGSIMVKYVWSMWGIWNRNRLFDYVFCVSNISQRIAVALKLELKHVKSICILYEICAAHTDKVWFDKEVKTFWLCVCVGTWSHLFNSFLLSDSCMPMPVGGSCRTFSGWQLRCYHPVWFSSVTSVIRLPIPHSRPIPAGTSTNLVMWLWGWKTNRTIYNFFG